jgi:HrpA-like RNA helicase
MSNFIPNNEHFLKRYRNIRNELLNRTDRYFLIDFPIEYEQQLIIKKYRKDLREFINNNEIKILAGETVSWPEQPDFIDLYIVY